MVLRLLQLAEHTAVGDAITASTWVYPVIQIVHLLGLTMLLGSVLVIVARLTGALLSRVPVRQVVGSLQRWGLAGLVVTVGSGGLLFLADVMKYYNSDLFFWKMGFLAMALLSTGGLLRLLRLEQPTPWHRRCVAGCCLALWFAVCIAGRSIAFV